MLITGQEAMYVTGVQRMLNVPSIKSHHYFKKHESKKTHSFYEHTPFSF